MLDKFVNRLNYLVVQEMMSGMDIKHLLESEDEEDRKEIIYGEFIHIKSLNDILSRLLFDFEREIKEKEDFEKRQQELKKPYKKFLFVEDGSVDIDNLVEEMEVKNPEIKVVVYRKDATKPEMMDLGEHNAENN